MSPSLTFSLQSTFCQLVEHAMSQCHNVTMSQMSQTAYPRYHNEDTPKNYYEKPSNYHAIFCQVSLLVFLMMPSPFQRETIFLTCV